MKYTSKQIKRILCIQEFVETVNALSKVYIDFENKEFSIKNLDDKNRIYKLYCASIYNLIKAIQGFKEVFANSKRYIEFEEMINQKFSAINNKYCTKEHSATSLFRIIETIRNQVNHYNRDDEDNNILFEIYVDFAVLENLRLVINDIFYEIYKEIDKKKIKEIILRKPKTMYSIDKLSSKVDEIKSKFFQNDSEANRIFKEDNDRALELLDDIINPENLYDLYTLEPSAIKKFDDATKELNESCNRLEEYVNKEGTDLEKEAMLVAKKFMTYSKDESEKELKERISKMNKQLLEIKEKYDKDVV